MNDIVVPVAVALLGACSFWGGYLIGVRRTASKLEHELEKVITEALAQAFIPKGEDGNS